MNTHIDPMQAGQGLGARTFASQGSLKPTEVPRARSVMDQIHAFQKQVKRQAAAPTRAGRAAKQQVLRTGEKAYALLPARVRHAHSCAETQSRQL